MDRTLRKSGQFRQVFRNGTAFRGKIFKAVYLMNSLGTVRLGFSLSARSGNAVKRNLLRRRLKHLFFEADFDGGVDVVIMPSGAITGYSWEELEVDFGRLRKEIEECLLQGKT